MPFTRGTATDYRDLEVKLDQFLTNRHIITAVVTDGGTAYEVGDLLTIAIGTGVVEGGMSAVVEVTAETGNVIDTVRIYDAGAYSTEPTPLVDNPVTGGTGSGAEITITLNNRHVSDVAIDGGGTGYAVGDLLYVLGGTVVDSLVTTIEVTSEAAGVIDGISITLPGSYSADPSTAANAVTTNNAGTGATIDLTMANLWAQRIQNDSDASVGVITVESTAIGTVGGGGSGYAQDDTVTLNSSLSGTSEATFNVDTVDGGGAVLTLSLKTPNFGGDYDAMTTSTAVPTTTSGSGIDLTLNPKFIPARDEYLWEGVGTGGNKVFIGVSSVYAVSQTQRSWELSGFTGWDGTSVYANQPGKSPNDSTIDIVTSGKGSYTLLSQNSLPFWFAMNERRVIVVANVDSGNYQSCHLGLLDPFGTESEIPYPQFICGTSDEMTEDVSDGSEYVRGPADPVAGSVDAASGPGFYHSGSGAWNKVWNGAGTVSITGNDQQEFFVYPTATLDNDDLSTIDELADTTPSATNTVWGSIIPPDKSTSDSNVQVNFKPSPDSGGDLYFPIQCTVVQAKTDGTVQKVIGEINGLLWVGTDGVLVSEDKVTVGTRVFRVFKMGANAQDYAHFCVEEI